MAGGSYSHFGGRKSSDFCSKITVVTFLGISCIGIWMLISSSFSIPLQNSEISSTNILGQYSGSSGDFPVNAKREEDETFQVEKRFRRGRSLEEIADEKGLDSYQNEEREGESSNLRNEEETQENSESSSSGDESQSGDESSNRESEEVDSREKDSTSSGGESDTGDEDSNPDASETTVETEKAKKGETENEVFPAADQSEILKEATTQNGPWSTQAAESEKENESQGSSSSMDDKKGDKWKLCKTDAGPDYIPCLDNVQAIRKLPHTSHYEHRERHCPIEASTCLVPLPSGYKQPIGWPRSRDQVYLVSAYP